jgi:TDG/mug DNA glycosylase family protein
MPGVESLKLQQYYANPRNQFWKLIFALFDLEPFENYEERVLFIKSRHIAIWDVIEMCTREGSLDSKIREEQVNDFRSLYKKYPNIKAIMFNGGKAFDTYKKWIGFSQTENLTFQKLTSSSPANTKKYDEKLREWCIIRDFLKGATHP